MLEKEFEQYAGIHKLNACLGIEIDLEVGTTDLTKTVKTAIDLVQKAAELASKTRDTELIEAIADLRVELAKVKIALGKVSH